MHDNCGSHDMHRLPFDGTINWPETMKAIANTGYSGATAIEAMNWDYTDLTIEDYLHEAFERAKKLEVLR